MIDWTKTTKKDGALIHKIGVRAVKRALELGAEIDLLDMTMDISACHLSNPLKLQELLDADNSNFCHDVFGIRKEVNRNTGELMNGFSPRYSK